jgi:predicted branched-subunit amino acid permease
MGETQVMSLTVFSAAAQVSAVSLMGEGTATVLLVATAMALNVQLVLLGLAVGREVRPAGVRRLVAAWFLTDGAFGIASGQGRLRLPVLLGAGVSMYLGFNAGTALGAVAGSAVPDLKRFGVDLVAPLTFLAVVVPMIRTRTVALVALVAGVTALLLAQVAPGGVAVLGAGVAGCGVGAWRTRTGAGGADR